MAVTSAPVRECIMLQPNRSLSAGAERALLAGLGIGFAALAGAFVVLGAWPVAPFLGLEFAAVAAAFYWLRLRARDCETLLLDESRLRVIRRVAGRERIDDFQRYWTRVLLIDPPQPRYPPRLVLRSHGREVEIGAMLGAEQRRRVAARLRPYLGPDGRG